MASLHLIAAPKIGPKKSTAMSDEGQKLERKERAGFFCGITRTLLVRGSRGIERKGVVAGGKAALFWKNRPLRLQSESAF